MSTGTICPKGSDQFYIVTFKININIIINIKGVTTGLPLNIRRTYSLQ